MNFSKINCRLCVLALLLTAVLFAGYSAGSDRFNGSARVPLHAWGATSVLQADGVRPPPPPPPPILPTATSSSQS